MKRKIRSVKHGGLVCLFIAITVICLAAGYSAAPVTIRPVEEKVIYVFPDAIGTTFQAEIEKVSLTYFLLVSQSGVITKGASIEEIFTIAKKERYADRLMNESRVGAVHSDANDKWYLIWIEIPSVRSGGKPGLFRIAEAKVMYKDILVETSRSYVCSNKEIGAQIFSGLK